jgi:hypothetical protein
MLRAYTVIPNASTQKIQMSLKSKFSQGNRTIVLRVRTRFLLAPVTTEISIITILQYIWR